MNEWVELLRATCWASRNLISFDDKDITTEYSALMSKVMANGNGRIKFPINEPAAGQEEVADRGVPRVLRRPRRAAHRASPPTTSSTTVTALRDRGVEFLRGARPATTTTLLDRVGHDRRGPGRRSRELGILVDRDDEGYLLQIFTKPVEDRPTLFFEIIQRKGATSFGKGNFKALFEAIEREQALPRQPRDMPIYHSRSDPDPAQAAHRLPRGPTAALYAEELMGHEGFIGTSSLLYHIHPPTTVKSARRLARRCAWEADDDTSLRHRHFRTAQVPKGGSPTLDRMPLLFNSDIGDARTSSPTRTTRTSTATRRPTRCVYVGEGQGHARDACSATCRSSRATTSSSTATSLHRWRFDLAAGRPSCWSSRAAGTCARPSATATSSASCWRARRSRERDIRRPTRAASRTTRRATSRSS